ncbi:MAG: hypothetical protein A2X08_02680 [Bacteroidetes bacterium GWA2_32_17]|nr:MAG: hypothetical protein A2X08_02680 [Bacteroidetes bacterium GWA2_32_17]
MYNYTNSGLPNAHISDIAIDTAGNKWFATYQGIVKFDGTNWTTYNQANSGLPHDVCYAIEVDKNNNLWIGTAGGNLAKFDGVNWTYYSPYSYVTDIKISENNDIWFCGWESGVAKYDGTIFTWYNTSNSPLLSNIVFVQIENDSTVWFSPYQHGIQKLESGNWTSFNSTNSGLPTDTGVGVIYIDKLSKEKYIGSNSNGLIIYDDINWNIYNTSNSLIPSNKIWDAIITSDSSLWLGGDKLIRYKNNLWTYYDTSNSPINSGAYNLIEDNNFDIWMATSGVTIYKLHLSTGLKDNISPIIQVFSYPNPFSVETSIVCDQSKIVEVSIFDLTGKKTRTIKGNNSYQLKITRDGLKSGFYLAKVQIKNNLQYDVKLIIN